MSHDMPCSVVNMAGRTVERPSLQSHLFLLHKPYISLSAEYRIYLCSDLSCTPLLAGVFKSSGAFDGCFWGDTLLKLAPREGLLFLPGVLFHFLIYFSSCLSLSGELDAHFSPKGLIILSCTPWPLHRWLLIAGHPICLESLFSH